MRVEDIPDRVEAIMSERDISKYYLTHKCQIQEKLLCDILKNRRYNMMMKTLQKLTDALGVTLGYFFSPKEEKMEITEEMKQVQILMEQLSPDMQNRILGYVQGVAEYAKEEKNDSSI